VQTVLARAGEIRAGALSFTLGQPGAASSGVVRVDRGAVTERIVKQAADAGARLVLAPRAVITPLAREKARALGVEIERER
jgi:2-keto-3-deoxy-L-rhamnonate aldolase RhmA